MPAFKQKQIHKPKKNRNHQRQIDTPTEFQPHLQISQKVPDQLQEKIEEELPTIKFLDRPIREISSLTEEERLRLKRQHPRLASYIFMSQRQRTKFFHQKNLDYRKRMQTPGNLPARTIHFKKNFEVRFFDSNESPQTVNIGKFKKQKYDQKLHYNQS